MEDYDAEDLNETDEYDYDYTMYQADNLPSIPLAELLTPLLVYSVTYVTGLIGNILILVAVTGQKQVSWNNPVLEILINLKRQLRNMIIF